MTRRLQMLFLVAMVGVLIALGLLAAELGGMTALAPTPWWLLRCWLVVRPGPDAPPAGRPDTAVIAAAQPAARR